MTVDTTTDLDVVRRTPKLFMWGAVRKIHDIGPYCLVEYVDQDNETRFHIYVNGQTTSTSCLTMDEALIFAIARKHLEINDARHMARAANRLFKIE